MEIIDKLLEQDCYVIDFLPRRVPSDSEGEFFDVEKYLLEHSNLYRMNERVICIILKFMCYCPLSVYCERGIKQLSPAELIKIIDSIADNPSGDLFLLVNHRNCLIQFGYACLNISIYNPDRELCDLFEKIAASEGMFWRKSE